MNRMARRKLAHQHGLLWPVNKNNPAKLSGDELKAYQTLMQPVEEPFVYPENIRVTRTNEKKAKRR